MSGGPAGEMKPAHYSYAMYADPAMAEAFDRQRFGGPIGALLAESQAAVLRAFAGDVHGRAVLDVGTGTGRGALLLAEAGARVTAVDASTEMLDVARGRAAARGLAIEFEVGDAHRLAHADASFDVAMSLRVLMHTPDWRRCLGELCRVSRSRVIVDYPALVSVAALQAAGRRLAALAGVRLEAYRVLTERDIARELTRHGFRIRDVHRQFVLPIALHKRVGSRAATRRIEGTLARAGLLRAFGSPVTVLAER